MWLAGGELTRPRCLRGVRRHVPRVRRSGTWLCYGSTRTPLSARHDGNTPKGCLSAARTAPVGSYSLLTAAHKLLLAPAAHCVIAQSSDAAVWLPPRQACGSGTPTAQPHSLDAVSPRERRRLALIAAHQPRTHTATRAHVVDFLAPVSVKAMVFISAAAVNKPSPPHSVAAQASALLSRR